MSQDYEAEMFYDELDGILEHVKTSISKVLLSEDRTSKHKPYTWVKEDIEEHLLKAARHIQTHILIKQGYQEPDDENHLDNAITRLSMAVAQANGNWIKEGPRKFVRGNKVVW